VLATSGRSSITSREKNTGEIADTLSIPASAVLDPDHPMIRYLKPIYRWQGDLIGYVVQRSICPALVESGRLLSEIGNGKQAAKRFKRLARYNDFRYMTTLTLPAGDRSRKAVQSLWQGFLKRDGLRYFHARKGGWLAVLEPHAAGGWHLHVLHRNRLNAATTRAVWTRYLLRNGYSLPAGTSYARTHERYFGSARKAALYAAKYMTKGFASLSGSRSLGEHRFLRSQGLSDGVTVRILDDWQDLAFRFPDADFASRGSHSFGEWAYLAWHAGGESHASTRKEGSDRIR